MATENWTFKIDTAAPAVSIGSPERDAVLALDALPVIQGIVADTGSGLDLTSLIVQLDGQSVAVQLDASQASFSYTVTQALTEGTHNVVVTVRDQAGNITTVSSPFRVASPPVISGMAPVDVLLPGAESVWLTAKFSDAGSGVDPGQLLLTVDGVNVTSQAKLYSDAIYYKLVAPIVDGPHTARLSVTDLAGNRTESTWQFQTAIPPTISAMSPMDVVLPAGTVPTITASFADNRATVNPASARMLFNGQDVTAQAQVSTTGISYRPTVAREGQNGVYVEVANQNGSVARALWNFEVAELRTYSLNVLAPSQNATVLQPTTQLKVSATANKTFVVRVTANGTQMKAKTDTGGELVFVSDLALTPGVNAVEIVATYADEQTRTTTATITYDAPPMVTIISPVDKTTFGAVNPTSPRDLTGSVERPVSIAGRVSKPVTRVTINQQGARLNGQDFTFDNFFLREGLNMITVMATDSRGQVGSASMTLSVDQTAPILSLEHPLSGAITSNDSIDLRGVVNDAVEGFVGAPEPTIRITNDITGAQVSAMVSNRYYLASGVPLTLGENRLTITATDHLSNTRQIQTTVTRIAVGSERLTMLSGNHQSSLVYNELSQPLSVVALNALGEPLANLPVSFDVVRGTGWISSTQGTVQKADGVTPDRNVIVRTDESGRAKVWFTVGDQTGAGTQAVRAWVNGAALSPGAPGSSVTEDVYFYADAEPASVSRVLADMGANQFAETNSQPMELLSAVVGDDYDNPIVGVPVIFVIEEGDAYFLNDQGVRTESNGQSITTLSDKNGLAAVRPFLGNTAGVVRVAAYTPENPADPNSRKIGGATYLIQALVAGSGPTNFRGYLYTDKGEPLPGARVSIGRTSLAVTTDESGAFFINDVPPGRIDLFVDGRTSSYRGETWPSLHFETTAVRGRDNQLPHPIYLPPLAMSTAKVVGGNEDVILTIPGLEGFQMKVHANSVTFPDGSKEGTLVVSPVVSDRLPMSPPDGAAMFGVPAWTIQPAGTRFDPPIEVTMPNTRALRSGDAVPVVQWDHDLAKYVPMGRATVCEDGTVLVTDAGSGVTKAGWGGPRNSDPNNCAQNSPPSIDSVKIKVEGFEEDDDIIVPVGEEVTLIAEAEAKNCTPTYRWIFDDEEKSGPYVTHEFKAPSIDAVELSVSCAATCSKAQNPADKSSNQKIYAVKLDFIKAWSSQLPGVEVNGHPGKTGGADTEYAIMGAGSDNVARVQVLTRIEPDNLPAQVREKILVSFDDYGSYGVGTAGEPKSPGDDGAVSLELDMSEYINMGFAEKFYLTAGIDKNGDGELGYLTGVPDVVERWIADASTAPGRSGKGWPFLIVSRSNYNAALSDWNEQMSIPVRLSFPAATEIVDVFMGRPAREGVLVGLRDVRREGDGLAHPIGISQWSGDIGHVPEYLYGDNTKLKRKVLASKELRDRVKAKYESKKGDLARLLQGVPQGHAVPLTEEVQISDLSFGVLDTDMFFALHDVRGGLRVGGTVRETDDSYILDIILVGELRDIFDFKITQIELALFDNEDAVYLQAGYPTLGSAGMVSAQLIQFDGDALSDPVEVKK